MWAGAAMATLFCNLDQNDEAGGRKINNLAGNPSDIQATPDFQRLNN
jgi:hypothetical protein